jgi:hypothetical protein
MLHQCFRLKAKLELDVIVPGRDQVTAKLLRHAPSEVDQGLRQGIIRLFFPRHKRKPAPIFAGNERWTFGLANFLPVDHTDAPIPSASSPFVGRKPFRPHAVNRESRVHMLRGHDAYFLCHGPLSVWTRC